MTDTTKRPNPFGAAPVPEWSKPVRPAPPLTEITSTLIRHRVTSFSVDRSYPADNEYIQSDGFCGTAMHVQHPKEVMETLIPLLLARCERAEIRVRSCSSAPIHGGVYEQREMEFHFSEHMLTLDLGRSETLRYGDSAAERQRDAAERSAFRAWTTALKAAFPEKLGKSGVLA